ncbi:zinc ABC transporter ATP-binding protein AztA [Nocardia caishijiensis]|uniref:Zinc/manganese transport system ATP-binding protein n=1 Tax=Nocardia caishijiensis TaxID=184756 RepID=A0ABQ6YJM7_9NOCA|nr:zinc ABC transporter ATP-binding protein AztA [Nocardia caishijiensis]KAF0845704.1 zinc/manganese transport system ATP-binding protein [Nocardia caishijiensis]
MQHTADPAILLEDVSAGYGRTPVLARVTAAIPRGQVTAIVGPNGSGKSTLLGVVAGTVPVRSGTVRVETTRRPAFVVQHTAIPTALPMTVREAVAMGRWAHRGLWRRLTKADRAIAQVCLERMDLTALATRRLDTLSGGQRQRTLLAQALAQESDLILLDEPATGLDDVARAEISDALTEIAAGGVTVVQATHDPAEAARADHCLRLRDGSILAGGSPGEVLGTVAYQSASV